ncbi:putative lipid phosphate phosphatase 3, chloroplastic isoform X2 [Phragmites australis]|uniref:putative lipid phosphate phosphatase 3, chloroplastic isoform X2 n=1 Tax=Phragmites australis TaxID=29695 RepID=UPI002D782FE2|nr:putative lipid phosphate phosphatase 3, chloroplastic isoform X2 [Phragmites australis]
MMREVQLGPHTIQTHGASLARKHTHDWVVLIFLAAVVIALHYAPPFSRFIGKDMMTDIRYPVKQSTVPAWGVPIISILCPWVIFISMYIARRDVYDLHHAALGVLFAVLITAVFTDVLKIAVGRPRPDFFWRCFPDGKQVYFLVTGDVICHGEKSFLTDGRKSFPSGHTSWSFAGLGFLSLYLSGKIKVFDHQGHVAKLCIVILPLLLASLVGISRIDNYRHHWEDVFAGGLIGYIMAILCYLHFFPPPYHDQGWRPYAYIHMLEELETTSSNDAQNQQSTGGHNIGLSGQRNRTPRNDLESGSV